MIPRHFSRCPVLLALVFSGAVVQAMQPLVTDDTGTQGEGRHQLEWAYARERASSPGAAPAGHEQSAVYTLGLHERLDVFAGASRLDGGGQRGWGNPVLGTKWRFHESEATHWALKAEIRVPVSPAREGQGLGTGRASGALSLILTQKMPFGEWHFNLVRGEDRYRAHTGQNTHYSRFSTAPVWDVAPDWKLALDVGLEHARSASEITRSQYAQLALIGSLSPELEWAAGLMKNREQGAQTTHSRRFTTGLTWRF